MRREAMKIMVSRAVIIQELALIALSNPTELFETTAAAREGAEEGSGAVGVSV